MSVHAVMMMRMVVAVFCGVHLSTRVRMFVVVVGADGDGGGVYVCAVVLVAMMVEAVLVVLVCIRVCVRVCVYVCAICAW